MSGPQLYKQIAFMGWLRAGHAPPLQGFPLGAAARRRLMRAKFAFITRQRVIAGNSPLIRPAATFPKGEGFIAAAHPSGSYIPSRLTNFCSISSL